MYDYYINTDTAFTVIKNYLDNLSATGYMRYSQVARILMYLFILDYVASVGSYFDEKVHTVVLSLLKDLFSTTPCLMNYPVINGDRMNVNEVDGTVTNKVGIL